MQREMAEATAQITASGETPLGPKLPLRLGRFTLCEELGAGGMATVYLARMQLAAGLERLVALKTIHPHLAKQKAFVDMFLDEARIASHVSHPNVCATHDFGEEDGVYYLAMEYLLGEPVFDVINHLVDRFDEVRDVLPYLAARILADACEGIHAAHTALGPDGEHLHIVHRDVSPQNLFLTYDGAVKVVDFGCAKATERVAHTSTGVMKGKVGYAAPEQIRGHSADARADIWALGVCLWETLTLSPLFSRPTAVATAMAVLDEEIEYASDGRDWIPDEVAAIAAKALSREPDGRYQSAREMSRALRRFISDSGYTLESAELAEWMGFLMSDQHAARLDQTKRVREMDISFVQPGRLYEVTDADVEVIGSEPLEAVPYEDNDGYAAPEVSGPMPRQSRTPIDGRVGAVSAPPALPKKKKKRGWLLVLLGLLALGVGGYYLHLLYEPAPWFLELIGRSEGSPSDAQAAGSDATQGSAAAAERDRADEDTVAAVDSTTGEANGEGADAQRRGAADSEADDREAAEPAIEESPDGVGWRVGSGAGDSPAPRRRRRERAVVTTVVSGGGAQAPAPAPAAPATGMLHLHTSSGWAVVRLGGRSLGRTPIDRAIPVGTHRLRILPYGNADAAETLVVQISSAADERLTIDVEPP